MLGDSSSDRRRAARCNPDRRIRRRPAICVMWMESALGGGRRILSLWRQFDSIGGFFAYIVFDLSYDTLCHPPVVGQYIFLPECCTCAFSAFNLNIVPLSSSTSRYRGRPLASPYTCSNCMGGSTSLLLTIHEHRTSSLDGSLMLVCRARIFFYTHRPMMKR